MALAVLLHVGVHRRRGERVEDRDLLARAVVLADGRTGEAVGAPQLGRLVSAGGIRLRLAVRGRLAVGDLLAPVLGARRGVHERGGRRRRRVGHRLVQADDAARGRGEARRERYLLRGRAQILAVVAIDVELGAERALRLADRPGGVDQDAALGAPGDPEAVGAEPALAGLHVTRGGGKAGAEGRRRQVVPVLRARRVGDRAIEALQLAGVAPGKKSEKPTCPVASRSKLLARAQLGELCGTALLERATAEPPRKTVAVIATAMTDPATQTRLTRIDSPSGPR